MSDRDVVLPSPLVLIRDMELLVPWEPTISVDLCVTLNLHSICHLGAISNCGSTSLSLPKLAAIDATSVASNLSNSSTSLLATLLNNLGYNNAPPIGLDSSMATPKTQQSQLQQNQSFNDALFGTFKGRLTNGKGVKSRTLQDWMLPVIPQAKGGGQLCLVPHQRHV